MLAQQLGANLKAARKAKGWSLEKLAAKVEPTTRYQTIAKFEKAQRPLTPEWIERIAKALEVDPMELLAPDLLHGQLEPTPIQLSEQVANEVARTLALVVLEGDDPRNGTVQVIALMLQELIATFAEHPAAARDVQMARPVLTLASKRFVPLAN
jgi:transcriptional regulator with XRE-family HTH domain